MKIVHISRTDGGDGASNVALRMHRGLLRLGHDSTMFVAQRRGDPNDKTVRVYDPPSDFVTRVKRRLRDVQISHSFAPYRKSRPTGYEAFSDDRTRHQSEFLNQLPACDILHVQQMYQFLDFRSFFTNVPQRTPVVRTLHDASFFAGGCHSPEGCDRYTEECGTCPQLGSQNPEDLSRQVWRRKAAVFQTIPAGRVYVVSPSRWLMNEAKRSSLLKNIPVVLIPNGVNTDVFHPRDRRCVRDVLGISQDALVVLFVAEPIHRPIKGFALLAQALERICREHKNLLLVSVGSGNPPLELQVPYMNLGPLRDERLLSSAYSAADMFVLPSRQENFPLTVLEAMACGTPVVGSAVGGVIDMVRPGVTGALFPPQDAAALASAISSMCENADKRAEMAANSRRIAVEEYSVDVQLKQHVELYERILAGVRPARN
jgi:glycosyltransferase involved in cell wall biosynthesis